MQQNAPFCVLPTAFSLSRVGMYGDVSGQWHLRLTKFYTIWLRYVYKIYSILKIQNITLDTEISWMYHR